MRFPQIGALVVVLALVSSAAWGAQSKISFEKLCEKAEHIVVGEVIDISYERAEWPGTGTLPFTNVTIRVAEEWKGQVEGRQLVVRVPGGRNPDGSRVIASGFPRFQEGEKVLVFTHTFLGQQWVYGNEQGKYTVIVQRVVGREHFPVDKDLLTYALKRRVEKALAAQPKKPRGG